MLEGHPGDHPPPKKIRREGPGTAFERTLDAAGGALRRAATETLQVNVGLLCNQECRHCHLEAGPKRTENMDRRTAAEVIAYARRCGYRTIDITGGAPELNPWIEELIEGFASQAARLMLRSNLTALKGGRHDRLMERLTAHKVVIVASLPALNAAQTDAQRGRRAFDRSIDALRKLNAIGYGRAGSELELNLVSNPAGAFFPPVQDSTEKRFREVLENKWGVVFHRLFNFANVPLGRFRQWLAASGNLTDYLQTLRDRFNPCAVNGVMCRTMVSVGWDGCLYDCDFNLACNLYAGKRRMHVSELDSPPAAGSDIATADHCFTCTAGSGFT